MGQPIVQSLWYGQAVRLAESRERSSQIRRSGYDRVSVADGHVPVAPSCRSELQLYIRLSALMFLAYMPAGAVVPLFALHLKQLNISPALVGWIFATQAAGPILAPLIAGQLADRYLSADRCLRYFALIAAGLLWLLADCTEPLPIFLVFLGFWVVMMPSLTLTTTLCLTHLPNVERQFGRARLWGTVGWIIPSWLMGWWLSVSHSAQLNDAIRFGSLLCLALAAYTLTLPTAPPRGATTGSGSGSRFAPLAAFRAVRSQAFTVYVVCLWGVCTTIPFTVQLTPLLLNALELPPSLLVMALTLSQATEVLALALLPWLLEHLGLRQTMVLGLVAWSLAFAVLTTGNPLWLVVGSLAFNGFCIGCFVVAGQVFVNRRATADTRASMQSLISCVSGTGLLSGSLLVGYLRHATATDFALSFAVGLGLVVSCLVLFTLCFQLDGQPAPINRLWQRLRRRLRRATAASAASAPTGPPSAAQSAQPR